MKQYDTYDETTLLKFVAIGDEQAFTEFYNRYWRKVYSFLIRMTKSHEIAEELLCDIFTKLWTGRELIGEIHNMDAFLSKVAYNKAINFLRLAAPQRKLQSIIASQMANQQAAQADEKLLDDEAQQMLHDAIRQLSPQRKLVFTLSREQGLTHEQIAQQLNLSAHTVKTTMSKALRSIRSFLSKRDINGI